jgi:hypothetical protein
MQRISCWLSTILQNGFGWLVKLYPPLFRQDFEQEMRNAFGDALDDAAARSIWMLLIVAARELLEFPESLAREYNQFAWKKESAMSGNMLATQSAEHLRESKSPRGTRWEAILAAMPFIFVLLLTSISRIVNQEGPVFQIVQITLVILLFGFFLASLILAWKRKWPTWSATWTFIYLALAGAPLSLVANWIPAVENNYQLTEFTMWIVIPMLIAGVLYRLARGSQLKMLLAAMPIIFLLWQPNLEFVPDQIELPIVYLSALLLAVAAYVIVRNPDWRAALWILLAVNIVVGSLFSYAGIYHGGALSFSAPGPSPWEVVKQMLPAYLACGAILIGPLLARIFREIGKQCGSAGEFSYRLALLAMIVILTGNLAGLFMGLNAALRYSQSWIFIVLNLFIGLGLVIYLYAVVLLFRAARDISLFLPHFSFLILVILPPGIPFLLTFPLQVNSSVPINVAYGMPWLFHANPMIWWIGAAAWLFLAVWLVLAWDRPASAPSPVHLPA